MAKSLGGNISESSLIKTALSAQTALYAYNDKAAADDWANSAKTSQDLQNYQNYINSRISGLKALPGSGTSIKSQTQLLNLNQLLDTTQKSYDSAEIARQTVNVLYGDESNTDKYNAIQGMMQKAYDTGDASLYQTLDETRARLSVTIQNEAQAAATKAAAAATKLDNATYAQQNNEHQMALDTIKNSYQNGQPLTNPDGSVIKVKYQNGSPVLQDGKLVPDANGKPLQLNAQQYAATVGGILQSHAATIQNHIASTGDPNGTYAKDLQALQDSSEYQQYATKAGMDKSQSALNPYVTDVKEGIDAQGHTVLTRSFRDDPLVPSLVADGKGGFTTQLSPQEGLVSGGAGQKFVYTHSIGSSPQSATDRTSSSTYTANTGNGTFTADGQQFKGAGNQLSFVNPNQNPLPNGQARAQEFLSTVKMPDGTTKAIRSIGTYANPGTSMSKPGSDQLSYVNPNQYGSTSPLAQTVQGVGSDIGSILSNKPGQNTLLNDFKTTAADVPSAAKGEINIAKNIIPGANLASTVAKDTSSGIGYLMNKLGFANQQRQQRIAAANEAAQKQAQLNAIAQANARLAEQQQAAYAAAQAAYPTINRINPATASPAGKFQAATGGSTAPSAVARGINAATGLTNFGGSGAWWNIK